MIGVIGDLHLRQDMAYADYVKDRREAERQAVLNCIVEAFKDCDQIVFLGDQFHIKNNPNQVVRMFTEFVERFSGKEIFILAGNHEKTADGKTAVDYLREIKNPKWHVITKAIEKFGDLVFCPYFYKNEVEAENYAEGAAKIMEILPEGKVLFVHHAVSDTLVRDGMNTNLFPEIVLPKQELEKRYQLIFGGHTHRPQQYGKTVIAGSIFTAEVGETEKFVWKIGGVGGSYNNDPIVSIVLPNRPIVKLENPSVTVLNRLLANPHQIVKTILTERQEGMSADDYRELLANFDAYVLVEQYPHERRQVAWTEGEALDFSIENLLRLYAKERKIDESKLIKMWEMIK